MISKKIKSGHSNKLNRTKRRRKELDELQPQIYQKFLTYLNNRRKKYLKDRLCEYYGKNFTVNYKDHYGFEQQWQQGTSRQQKYCTDYIRQDSKFEVGSSILIICSFIFTIWVSNIDFFFKVEGKIQDCVAIYGMAMAVQIYDMMFKVWKKISNKQRRSVSKYQCFKVVFANFVSILYFGLKMGGIYQRRTIIWTIFQVAIVIIIYQRLSRLYKSLRFMTFALHYEYHCKIVDLILTLMAVLHIAAIILFVSTTFDNEITWLSSLNVNSSHEYIAYLYSFYFAATTILTVGYGDISPKNPTEVGIVTLVEIFGIVVFAYLINEIGYSISTLRKDREMIQRDLSTMQKLKRHYKMEDSLVSKARSYLINTKPKIDQVLPDEQSKLLMKFNQDLRTDISKQNNISVIKSSIFFLSKWSKAFQKAASRHLTHVLFSPNQMLYQPFSKQRIYIIRVGNIHIYAQRNSKRRGMNNILKKIEITIDKEVSDNCYGYTAVISTRTSRLYAYAKDFTSAYFIDKDKFKQCLRERMSDNQNYHQIKSKIDNLQCWESFQVPLLESSRHHYNPTKINIIRKESKTITQQIDRVEYIRSDRSHFRGTQHIFDPESIKYLRAKFDFDSQLLESSNDPEYRVGTLTDHKITITMSNSLHDIDQYLNIKQFRSNFSHYFQSSKNYSNYFPRKNSKQVLRRYEQQYFLPKKEQQLALEYSSTMYRQLCQTRSNRAGLSQLSSNYRLAG